MLMSPAILALILGSFLVGAFVFYGSAVGCRIIRSWNLASGSEQQLLLERKTYLVSTILNYAFAFEIFSLLLYVYTADHLHNLFVGAMCAAGSLNVNDYGYPTLVLKMANVFLCGIWIVMNHADNKAYDYPLIRVKYKFLMWIAALLAIEILLQTSYFAGLKADVITSCCGSLFGEHGETYASEIAGLPPKPMMVFFLLSIVLCLRLGVHFLWTGKGAKALSGMAAFAMVLSFISIISFISLYFYELPTHHCPFCILQREYGYIGYALYLALFVAGISGTSVGALERLKGKESMRSVIPPLQKKLCIVCMAGFTLFAAISSYPMIFSDFVLQN
jgi:hypothetical protein